MPFQAINESKDQRRWSRHCLDVRVTALIGQNKKAIRGWAQDLSRGGLAVSLPVELVIGNTVHIEFTLPYSSRTVVVGGIVRSRRSFTYGIEFKDARPDIIANIERACRSMALIQ